MMFTTLEERCNLESPFVLSAAPGSYRIVTLCELCGKKIGSTREKTTPNYDKYVLN